MVNDALEGIKACRLARGSCALKPSNKSASLILLEGSSFFRARSGLKEDNVFLHLEQPAAHAC